MGSGAMWHNMCSVFTYKRRREVRVAGCGYISPRNCQAFLYVHKYRIGVY